MNNISPPPDYTMDLELFFELSPDFLCIASYDGYFKRVNPTVSKVLGYTPEELYAHPISHFVYPEDRKTTAESRNQMLKGVPLLNFENRYLTKTGEIVWLSWTSMPVETAQCVYAIAKNVTHKKKIEADRNALLTHLTHINSELKQLTYTTSHDLRSPVNNLLSVFSLLDTSKIQDAETLEFIEILKSAAEVLKQTLNTYVDHLSHHDVQMEMERLNLAEVLGGVMLSLKSLLQHSRALVQIDFSKLEEIAFNKSYLESIFLNLITNSIKYAKPDCPPEISISSRWEKGLQQLIYSDNGLGFDLDTVKDKIFGLHQTFHPHSDSKGIGLYLIYNHIKRMGGHIQLESSPNQGATFVISLKR
ncbi:MAG: PAS domain-containing sensor histidine kinase [Candidatus Sericytochromatia bacterium]